MFYRYALYNLQVCEPEILQQVLKIVDSKFFLSENSHVIKRFRSNDYIFSARAVW